MAPKRNVDPRDVEEENQGAEISRLQMEVDRLRASLELLEESKRESTTEGRTLESRLQVEVDNLRESVEQLRGSTI